MNINVARENMLKYCASGNESFTTIEEILSVIVGGHANKIAVLKLSRLSLGELSKLAIEEIIEYGFSKNQALSIYASFLVLQRYIKDKKEKGYAVRSPEDAANYLMESMKNLDQEYFVVMFLNTKNEVIKSKTIFIGSLNSSIVHPRETYREALKCSAASVIISHNHPTGDPSPSQEDILVTKRFVEVGKIMGMEVLDHIVIGYNRFVSMKQKGYI